MVTGLRNRLMQLYQIGQTRDAERLLGKLLKKRCLSEDDILRLLSFYRQPDMKERRPLFLERLVSGARSTPALMRTLSEECLQAREYGLALSAIEYLLHASSDEVVLNYAASLVVTIPSLAVPSRKKLLKVLEVLAARREGDLALCAYHIRVKRECCDWRGLDKLINLCSKMVDKCARSPAGDIIHPSLLMYAGLPQKFFRRLTDIYACKLRSEAESSSGYVQDSVMSVTDRKLRIGYISANFYNHAVGVLCFRMFGVHDRNRFEVHVYSLRCSPGPYQNTIARESDVFRDVSSRTDQEIVQQIRDDKIDILVDMSGYADSGRSMILASRPAPVQISYLGYLNTMGPGIVDYIIADPVVIPESHATMYSERVIRLPQFMVVSELSASTESCDRATYGLPVGVFVFGSFNAPYKIDARVMSSWMLILKKVPCSILWLYSGGDKFVESNLLREAGAHGIHGNRIVFADKVVMEQNLARIAQVDLMLDTFLFSGGATTVSAMLAGVPVLTLRGKTYLQRMSSSMNMCLGLGELDCADVDEYVEKAVMLANTPEKMNDCREKVAVGVHKRFNIRKFVASLELAYTKAWHSYLSGAAFPDITVENDELVDYTHGVGMVSDKGTTE